MKIFALSAIIALSSALNLREEFGEDGPTTDWEDGEWTDPCEEFYPGCELAGEDPCAGTEDNDADWDACIKGDDMKAFEAEIETCIKDMSDDDFAALMQCFEQHPIDMESEFADEEDEQ